MGLFPGGFLLVQKETTMLFADAKRRPPVANDSCAASANFSNAQ